MIKFGCWRDKMDERDYLMRAYLPVVKIPAKVDHTKEMSPVRDQGDEGTCVGFASTTGMKEYQENKDYNKVVNLSPRFLYNECKKIDGISGEGTTIRSAMKALKEWGVCQEKYWPYKPHQQDKPKTGAKENARKFSVFTYARVLDLNELRMNLAQKGPCVIGVQVFNGMMEAKKGLVPMPKKGESSVGGHAICPVGYDDQKDLVKFKNSWSESWGDKGYGYLSYEYIRKYMMDAWSSVDIEDPNPLTLAMIIEVMKEKTA